MASEDLARFNFRTGGLGWTLLLLLLLLRVLLWVLLLRSRSETGLVDLARSGLGILGISSTDLARGRPFGTDVSGCWRLLLLLLLMWSRSEVGLDLARRGFGIFGICSEDLARNIFRMGSGRRLLRPRSEVDLAG